MQTRAQSNCIQLGVLCALALTAAGTPAVGQPSADPDAPISIRLGYADADPDAPISIRLGYADLNLTTAAGASAMLQRIKAAASQACGAEPDIKDLRRATLYNRCRTQTVARALATLNAPLVTALADGSSPLLLSRR